MSRAIAVFRTDAIVGEVEAIDHETYTHLCATFTKLPSGPHGFHIHTAGDLRGEGCQGLCEHYDKGKHVHGDGPHSTKERHTGDLGNIVLRQGTKKITRHYDLKGVRVADLWGRSIIVHADRDDLGKGKHTDSLITGHSGKRLGCALFGRVKAHHPTIRRRRTTGTRKAGSTGV